LKAKWKTLFDVGSRYVYLCHFIHDVKREIGFVLDISEALHITIPRHRSRSVGMFGTVFDRQAVNTSVAQQG